MRHVRGLNKRARRTDQAAQEAHDRQHVEEAAAPEGELDVEGRAPVPVGCIGNVFNPGWETDCAALETTRLCPGGFSYHTDTVLCNPSCWWPAQVPDKVDFPDWLKDCGNIYKDWQKLCFVPD